MIHKRFLSSAAILLATLSILALAADRLPALADGPRAVAWLKTQQNDDGGFGSPASSAGATADVLLAVAATGDNALHWSSERMHQGQTSLDYLKANVRTEQRAGILSKIILALIASGQNPRTSLGVDLVARLEGMVGSDGKIGGPGDLNEHCFSLIALRSAQRPIPAASIQYLLQRQIADGTWSWNGDTAEGSGDNNTAAIAVVALIAAGVPADHAQIQKTLAHLKEQQNDDGGFPYISPSPFGTDSDANSTAVAMWAIVAAGQDPAGVDWKYMAMDGRSALDRLRAFQNDNGAFRWQDAMPDDNFLSTVQAIIAMELETLPFAVTEAAMDVGTERTPQVAAEAATEAPITLPETGAETTNFNNEFRLWIPAVALLGSGIVLVGTGLSLRRRVGEHVRGEHVCMDSHGSR